MIRFPRAVSALAILATAAMASSAFATDIPIPNAGFEGPNPGSNQFGFNTGWTAANGIGVGGTGNYSGAFTTYAGFSPAEGNRMALLANQGLSWASLHSTTPVALSGQFYLNFSWAYLSTEAAGTSGAALDTFKVIIDYYSDAAGLTQVSSQTSVVPIGGHGDLFDTGTSELDPFGGAISSNAQGGALKTYTVLLNNPIAPYARFTFYLDNDGTGTGKSGLLLDKAFVNPEPGTIALFGLGALGLGAMTWRRRRSKAKTAQ